MTATIIGRSRLARISGIGVALALLAATFTPTIALANETPAEVAADGATLALVRPSETGAPELGLSTPEGAPVDPAQSVLTVATTDSFPALFDASAFPSDGGYVQISWDAAALPGGVAPGTSDAPTPQILVTSDDGASWLLGTATDAPAITQIPAGGAAATRWQFTAPGAYTVTATATLLDAHRAVLQHSPPVTYSFLVSQSTPLAEQAQTEPPVTDAGSEAPVVEATTTDAPAEPVIPFPMPGQSPGSPLPEGQSDQPAPDSNEKRVIGAVHTDAVSAYLDAGALVLETKADIDVTGDGFIDLGTRLTTSELLFHLSDAGKITIPDLPAYSFLGKPGSTIWMAPQTQDHRIIWPGFSTEDPNFVGKVQNNKLAVRLIDTKGPGSAEVYMQDGGQVKRIFSSTTILPAWEIGVPQHTHMNWAFSNAGTYTFTFEVSGVVDGRMQTASNDYTFVVGDLDKHTQATTTTLAASAREVKAGDSVLLTAELDPQSAVGAVQFRDMSSGSLLGHTPVRDGAASFRADALSPGAHRIVAEFVPTWTDDFVSSTSRPLTVTVEGQVQVKPDYDDTTPVPASEIGSQLPGTTVLITTAGKKVTAGGSISLTLRDPLLGGSWVSVWLPGQDPAWQGWTQADLHGAFSVDLSNSIKTGNHQLVLKDTAGSFVGWDEFSVTSSSSGGGRPILTPPPLPGQPPTPVPQAPGQTCAPGVTLETGHIDAFYVSAANGKAVLQLMEDVTGYHVIREAETVLLKVKESAYRSGIPAGMPGAPSGYVLPLTQDPGLIWPGWDTNRTASSGYTDVSINVTGVNGPGRVYLSSQGSFGGVASLLQGGGYTFPGSIREATPAHTHAQWVFSQKGIYKLTAHAVVTNPSNGQSLSTAAHTYVFQVGDVPLGDAFCGLRSAGAADASEVNKAVNAAAADAVAAARESAVQEAAEGSTAANLANRFDRTTGPLRSGHEGLLDQLFGEDADPAVVAGVAAGGALIILGIAGATIWYIRRLRTSAALPEVKELDT